MVMPILQIAELVSGGARLTPGQCGADTMRLTPTTGGGLPPPLGGLGQRAGSPVGAVGQISCPSALFLSLSLLL